MRKAAPYLSMAIKMIRHQSQIAEQEASRILERMIKVRHCLAFALSSLILLASACSAGGGGDSNIGGSNGSNGSSNGSSSSGDGDGLIIDGTNGLMITDKNRDEDCNTVTLEFEEVTPTVMILVDRSTSMRDQMIGNKTRWDALRDALIGPDNVLEQFQDTVRFGFMSYTSEKFLCPQEAVECAACTADTGVVLTTIMPDFTNFDAIQSTYSGMEAGLPDNNGGQTETPTAAAVQKAVEILQTEDFKGQKYLFLVTDGEPDACNDGDPCPKRDHLLAQVQATYADGIRTFAMTVDAADMRLGDHVKDIAAAGRGFDVPLREACAPQYPPLATYTSANPAPEDLSFHPDTDARLRADLASAIGGVRTCSYKLNARVTDDGSTGEVGIVNENDEVEQVAQNDADGWQLVGDDTVEYLGGSCEKILAGEAAGVDIYFPCEVLIK